MSYDEIDAWQDAGVEAMYEEFRQNPATRAGFYEELYEEIVGDFAANRLQSYYLEQPKLAEPSAAALDSARALVGEHATAGFVFGAIAAEVTLRTVLLRPIVYGLVHSDSAAALITKLAIRHQDE